jgi:phosphoglycolate phosphatase-like HAD superfamily hydrolase
VTTVLFWDIDGTLLTTARAGIHAWEAAVEEQLGRSVDLTNFQTAGVTDVEIARQLAAMHEIDPAHLAALLQAYERHLPPSLGRRAGTVLPNVRAILERLRGRPDVYSALLTGNTRAGAAAKLRHYALAEFFDGHGGAFADGAEDRAAIARDAIAQAQRILGAVSPERVYVIGDTPHDVACGKAIGARVVAVATGGYTMEQLRASDPWLVLSSLPEPDAFLSRLGLSPSLESV